MSAFRQVYYRSVGTAYDPTNRHQPKPNLTTSNSVGMPLANSTDANTAAPRDSVPVSCSVTLFTKLQQHTHAAGETNPSSAGALGRQDEPAEAFDVQKPIPAHGQRWRQTPHTRGKMQGKQAACNSMTCRHPARAVVQQLTAGLVQLRLESIIEITTGIALTVSQTHPHSLLVVMQEEVCEGQAHNHGDHRVL